jgi:Zn-dependent M28 family amino/carboxypeptidase
MLAFVRRRLPPVLLTLLLVLGAVGGPAAAPAPARGDAKRPPALTAHLKAHLKALQAIATKHGGARAAGTPGERASFAYVSRALKRAGWRVQTQRFGLLYFYERSAPALSLVGGSSFQAGTDFTSLTYSGSGGVEGRLRPAGSGCAASELKDLGPGDVALVDRGGCLFRVKVGHAQAAGASALIVIDNASGTTVPVGSLLQVGTRIPAVIVGAPTGQALRAAAPSRIRVRVDAISERRRSRNLLAETTSAKGSRVVMAGAHVDSVPTSPGINDNGSGVAALLEVARALGGRAPGARVRLAFWGAEEPGLFGSTYYVDQLGDVARRQIAAYLNLDVIGSPNAKRAVYSGGDPGIEGLLRSLVGAPAVKENQSQARSDHVPFQVAGIPTGGLFTGAGAPWDACYHRPCDRVSNVDLKLLTQLTRVTDKAIVRLSRQAK